MNPQGRFRDRADDYAKYRPSYPVEAIDCILEGLGEPEVWFIFLLAEDPHF